MTYPRALAIAVYLVLSLGLVLGACATGSSSSLDDDTGPTSNASSGVGGAAGGAGGTGGTGGCISPDDCPGQDTTCATRSCEDAVCGQQFADAGMICSDAGGLFCDGAGQCVQCVDGSQCLSGVCVDGACAEPSCDDTVANGSETDVDCGGDACPSCQNGWLCLVASDCISLFCDAQLNPAECAACTQTSDCASAPGTYCDAGVCVPQLPNGSGCSEAEQCVSGFCPIADGVCCQAACDQPCQSCSMAGSTLADGVCGPTLACISADGCCPTGCTSANDSDCALIDLNVGTHGSIYSAGAATRGFWFTAPVSFTIKELRVPNESGSGAQNFQVVKLNVAPPIYSASTTNFVTLHYSTGAPGTGYLPVNIPVTQGDIIGILGSRGTSLLTMSYSTVNPVNSAIFGQTVALNRLVYQANMFTTAAGPLSTETGGSIGRVELRYSF